MAENPNGDLYEASMALLAAEKLALQAGDFHQLEALYEQKHELLKRIESRSDELSRAQLDRMAQNARENDRLLDAAQRGLRAVARRLSETRRAADHLDTYTDAGKREDLAPAKTSFEKRA